MNVDALIDYEDVASGKCTSDKEIAHTTMYCMPGVVDIAAARIVMAL